MVQWLQNIQPGWEAIKEAGSWVLTHYPIQENISVLNTAALLTLQELSIDKNNLFSEVFIFYIIKPKLSLYSLFQLGFLWLCFLYFKFLLHSVVDELAALTLLESLLKSQNLRPHSRPTESEHAF